MTDQKNKDQKIQKKEDSRVLAKDFALYDPGYLKTQADTEIEEARAGKEVRFTSDTSFYKLATTYEFENSTLLTKAVGVAYKALAHKLTTDLQKEYKCETASQKTLAHTAALSFVRMMEIQARYSELLNRDSISELVLDMIDVLAKDFDRAHRQYQASIKSLQLMRTPPINIQVRSTTANIANQQVVQENHNDTSK